MQACDVLASHKKRMVASHEAAIRSYLSIHGVCIFLYKNIGNSQKILSYHSKIFKEERSTSIAKVNSGRSIPKAEVTSTNSQAEVTLANFYISVLFHAIV